MHAAILEVQVADRIRQGEVAQRLAEGVFPVLRQRAGLAAVYLVAAEDGSIVCFSVHVDQSAADEAAKLIARWTEHDLTDLVTGPATVVFGTAWTAFTHEPHFTGDSLE